MTKKDFVENITEDKKTKLKWRLANKPTLEDVTIMLDKEIISKEEAKEMLFSEEKALTRDETVKALQEQVEFQKTVIEKLMEKSAPVVWNYINNYTPRYPWNGLTYAQPVMLTGNLNKNLIHTITASGVGTTSGTTLTTAYSAVSKSNNIVDC